jgi:peroxiredoxin
MRNTRKSIIVAVLGIFSLAAASAAQDFSFSTPAGQTVSLSSLRGNVVVLLFSGLQDPQRREGLKAVESLADRYSGKNVKVYWVSVNNAAELSNDQLKGMSSAIPVLRDNNQAAFKRLSGKVAQLPTVVILDGEGKTIGQPRGGFNPNSDFVNDLASVIDRQLQR